MIKTAIAKAMAGQNLSEDEMTQAMDQVMEGRATPAQIGAFLVALRIKGETVEEIAAAAQVMRRKATAVPSQAAAQGRPLVDTCGTGGDGAGTFNVSTTAAFVVAGAGCKVAKHGNRAVSSSCGSADLMERLGVNLDLSAEQVGVCLDEVGIGFLFAPALHGAMKHAIGPRRELGLRTIFNVLGPLTNPAGATAQVMGVFDPALTTPLAHVLGRLGCQSAYVVHGQGGYDEITITGPSNLAHLCEGRVKELTLRPEDLGLTAASAEAITARDAAHSQSISLGVLQGQSGPARDMVLLNAAAALAAAGAADGLADGLALAAKSIDEGAALAKMEQLVAFTAQTGKAA
ncbi:anthranilate phosphoribosyltransferase [Desulfarculus baarsii DSM 2075]|uniref:Anthranilate phosphoribosyltransferase n=1 Tax=Desulfarculus baarsii (strain ATCC 33931 / DSM 2075 / LMG 7858 / VKM B-1802 / 2st14) TaxID=644282 RepID=E1QEM2_DESB2|nr:anthranilate phosphoribosyltransferase [Desulfarculus baarsii]ADK84008.1 anthranilate phosphoribosyltransferase [Desulfarculus baarsii DSM 2075]